MKNSTRKKPQNDNARPAKRGAMARGRSVAMAIARYAANSTLLRRRILRILGPAPVRNPALSPY